jgi:DNA anti-recombination protein RmuC
MEENSRKQLRHSQIQFFFSIISAVCCVVLVWKVMGFMPQLKILAEQMQLVLVNLEAVSGELQKLDLIGMVDNINSLVTTSQGGVEQTLRKIEEIDIDTLNRAVKDLADIVQPLADFIKKITKGGFL